MKNNKEINWGLKRILLFSLHVAADNQHGISGKRRFKGLKSVHMPTNSRRTQCKDFRINIIKK